MITGDDYDSVSIITMVAGDGGATNRSSRDMELASSVGSDSHLGSFDGRDPHQPSTLRAFLPERVHHNLRDMRACPPMMHGATSSGGSDSHLGSFDGRDPLNPPLRSRTLLIHKNK